MNRIQPASATDRALVAVSPLVIGYRNGRIPAVLYGIASKAADTFKTLGRYAPSQQKAQCVTALTAYIVESIVEQDGAVVGVVSVVHDHSGVAAVHRCQCTVLHGCLTVSVNDGAAAAVAGLGILAIGRWGCHAELDDGLLVPVLSGWRFEPVAINAVFPAVRAARSAARAWVTCLIDELKPVSI